MSFWSLSKTFRFEASHQLEGHDGKCARLHGHSWSATVTVRSSQLEESGPKSGMVIDYGELKELVSPVVERHLDHHHLNQTLQTERPTSEFIARWLFERLEHVVPQLHSVAVEETCTSRCEYVGAAR